MERLVYSERAAARGKIYIFMCVNVEREFLIIIIFLGARSISASSRGRPVIRFEIVTLKTR